MVEFVGTPNAASASPEFTLDVVSFDANSWLLGRRNPPTHTHNTGSHRPARGTNTLTELDKIVINLQENLILRAGPSHDEFIRCSLERNINRHITP